MRLQSITLAFLVFIACAWPGAGFVKADDTPWYEIVEFSGDIRFRYENIQKDGTPERDRQRVRARLRMLAPIGERWLVIMRLASGGEEPTSTNQTLGDSFTTKTVYLDQAFFSYEMFFNHLWLYAGKMKNPFRRVGKNQLIWDSDVNMEGMAGKGSLDLGPVSLFANGGGFWVKEQKHTMDLMLYAGQIGAEGDLSGIAWTIGGSYYIYLDTRDQETFFDPTNSFGNSSYTQGGKEYYLYQYKIAEAFLEVSTRVMDYPVKVFGTVVKNYDDEVQSRNSGHALGFVFNRAKQDNSWEIGYKFKKVDKDAVLGVFTDSDFAGGGTDGMGHVGHLSYVPVKGVKLSLTHFNNQIQADLNASRLGYRRTQIDLNLRF